LIVHSKGRIRSENMQGNQKFSLFSALPGPMGEEKNEGRSSKRDTKGKKKGLGTPGEKKEPFELKGFCITMKKFKTVL